MFSWYLNRLRLMSLPEIGLRFYRKVRQRIWKVLLPLTSGKPFGERKDLGELWGEWPARLTRLFPVELDAHFRERYSRSFPLEAVIEKGEKLVQGRFPIFEGIYETKGMVPDWHQDGLDSPAWPKVFFGDLNHNDLRYGRIINVWELNRHFHFYDLGKAYRLTGDRRYAQTLVSHLDSWIDQNPLGKGINWLSPLECGLRLISWLWGLFFICSDEGGTAVPFPLISLEQERKILSSMYWQAYFIDKNLSKYSSANNHRIGEALGLFWVGSLIPSFPGSDKWKKKGWKILCREIENQIFPDGVSREQSTRYLFFVFDLYTLAIALAQKEGLIIPEEVWNRLEKICEYVMAMMDERGHLPDLGDSSDGIAFKLHSTALNPYRSLLTTGSVWFNRGDFKFRGNKMDERNFWLWGEEAFRRYEAIEKDASERGSQVFAHGGQIVLRKGKGREEAVLTFDAGSFGYLSIAAHAHADALSFTLSLGGRPFLIDPGTYLYHDGGKWRKYFRGTRAHNTIEVDGQDQGQSGGPFMWLFQPKTFMGSLSLGPEMTVVQAFHRGYERLSSPVRHERSILWNLPKQTWNINDRLETRGPHSILQAFHFHPECRIRSPENNLFEVFNEERVLYLKMDPRLQTVLHQGEERPVWGWVSPYFGVKIPTVTLVGEMAIQQTEIVQTVLWAA